MSDFSPGLRFLIGVLAVWRVSHLFVAEDGPGDIVVRFRASLGDSSLGKMLDCFYCTSFWVAAPFAALVADTVYTWLICWLAMAGGAALLEQGTTSKEQNR